MNELFPFHRKLKIGFGVLLALLIGVGLALYFSAARLLTATEDLERTVQVIQILQRNEALILRAQGDVRAYAITGDESYLQDVLGEGARRYRKGLQDLRGMTADSPMQQRRIDRLSAIADEYRPFIRRVMEARRQSRDAALEIVPGPQGKQFASVVVGLFKEMEEEETVRLAARTARARRYVRTTATLGGVAVVLCLAVGVAMYWFVTRELVARRRLTQRFELLFRKNPLPLWVYDRETLQFLEVNDTAVEVYGYSHEEFLSLTIRDVRPPEDVDRLVTSMERIHRSDSAPRQAGQWRHRKKDGTIINVEVTLHRITFDGRSAHLVMLNDVTERNQLLLALEASRDEALTSARLKSEFLANMSHEIRTPLNGVIGMTELLLQTSLDPEQRDFAGTIRTSSDALLNVINDILDFSKIEAGKLAFEEADFEVRSVVEDAVDMVAEAARRKSLELVTLVYPEVRERYRGDPGRLRQILLNLLSNAVKFTETGEVIVRVQPGGPTDLEHDLNFSVTDTGIGIPVESQGKLFSAFTQVDGSNSRRYGGTGLGLSISRRLTEMMGGEMDFESQPGKGSTFRFKVRLRPPAQPPSGEIVPPLELAGKRAFIVDDNPTNRQVLVQQFAGWGVETVTADGGTTALRALDEATAAGRNFDVAVLDMHMPDCNGLELAERIHARSAFSSLPLLLLTSSHHSDPALVNQAGIAACLPKPVRTRQLREAVRLAMGGGRERRVSLPEATSAAPGGGGYRLLLVEDSEINRLVARTQLELGGYQVTCAVNGREAVEIFSREPFDLVLMDCQMPEMDGFDATLALRAHEGKQGVANPTPVIALTASALVGEREKCLAAGMNDYLAKPFTSAQLRVLLEKYLPPRAVRPRPIFNLTELNKLPTLDERILREVQLLSGEDPDAVGLVAELISLFLENTVAKLAELKRAVGNGDGEAVRGAAHFIRGGASQIGAIRLTEMMKRVEAEFSGPRDVFPDECLAALDAEFETLRARLIVTSTGTSA
jgi:PAS domain S-box-containing protein